MVTGSLLIKRPPPGYLPAGYVPPQTAQVRHFFYFLKTKYFLLSVFFNSCKLQEFFFFFFFSPPGHIATLIFGACVVSGTPHPAVWDTHRNLPNYCLCFIYYFSLWIKILWIWIRIQNFGPIWIPNSLLCYQFWKSAKILENIGTGRNFCSVEWVSERWCFVCNLALFGL